MQHPFDGFADVDHAGGFAAKGPTEKSGSRRGGDRQPRERHRQHRVGRDHPSTVTGYSFARLRSRRKPSAPRATRPGRCRRRRATTSRACPLDAFETRFGRDVEPQAHVVRDVGAGMTSATSTSASWLGARRASLASSSRDVSRERRMRVDAPERFAQRRLAEFARVQARADAHSLRSGYGDANARAHRSRAANVCVERSEIDGVAVDRQARRALEDAHVVEGGIGAAGAAPHPRAARCRRWRPSRRLRFRRRAAPTRRPRGERVATLRATKGRNERRATFQAARDPFSRAGSHDRTPATVERDGVGERRGDHACARRSTVAPASIGPRSKSSGSLRRSRTGTAVDRRRAAHQDQRLRAARRSTVTFSAAAVPALQAVSVNVTRCRAARRADGSTRSVVVVAESRATNDGQQCRRQIERGSLLRCDGRRATTIGAVGERRVDADAIGQRRRCACGKRAHETGA